MSDLLTLSNPVFSSLTFCSSALVLKMVGVALTTATKRLIGNVFINPEDSRAFGSGAVQREGKTEVNESVERVRRILLNDLENIPSFIFIGLLYTLTGPAVSTAVWHFRIFTISRFLHMICYQFAVPQPSRALCFGAGLLSTASMAVQLIRAAAF